MGALSAIIVGVSFLVMLAAWSILFLLAWAMELAHSLWRAGVVILEWAANSGQEERSSGQALGQVEGIPSSSSKELRTS